MDNPAGQFIADYLSCAPDAPVSVLFAPLLSVNPLASLRYCPPESPPGLLGFQTDFLLRYPHADAVSFRMIFSSLCTMIWTLCPDNHYKDSIGAELRTFHKYKSRRIWYDCTGDYTWYYRNFDDFLQPGRLYRHVGGGRMPEFRQEL